MERRSFDLPVATALMLQARSGKITVIAEPREDVLVEGDNAEGRIVDTEGRPALRVRSGHHGSKSMTAWCPVGTDVMVGTQSGWVKMRGEFGHISVTTVSGYIDVDEADKADLRSISANLTLRACSAACRLSTKSGSISVGEAGSAMASTVSGPIRLDHVNRNVKARSISGSVEVSCEGGGGIIAIETVSGRVRIALPEGTEPEVRMKSLGRVRSELRSGNDCVVRARSLSGSIEVVSA